MGIERNVRYVLFSSVVSLAFASGCASQVDEDARDEPIAVADQSIIGGRPASSYTEAALINTSSYICSGSVIAPRVVLTAGHCIGASSYTVIAPYAGKQARGTRTWTPYVSTGSTVNPRTLDVGVIILDTPIDLPSYPPLASAAVPSGTQAINVGRIKDGQASNSALFYGRAVTLRPASGFPYAYASSEIIQSGDSGGPVYTGSSSNRKIVAVNSGAGGGTQILARLDLAYEKIQQLIAESGGSGRPESEAESEAESDASE